MVVHALYVHLVKMEGQESQEILVQSVRMENQEMLEILVLLD